MGEETRKILNMLAKGKISVDDAERLLSAVSDEKAHRERPRSESTHGEKPKLRYLNVVVEPGPESKKKEKVNIRVPLKLVRSGLKWASFIPKHARTQVDEKLKEKGIDLDFTQMAREDVDELMENLNDLSINVDGEEKVRIFCE